MDNVESSDVLLPVHDGTGSAHVATAGDHDEVADLKLDEVVNLVCRLDGRRVGCTGSSRGNRGGGEEELNGVVDLDGRVGVADGSAVVGDEVRDALGTELDAADLAELVCMNCQILFRATR